MTNSPGVDHGAATLLVVLSRRLRHLPILLAALASMGAAPGPCLSQTTSAAGASAMAATARWVPTGSLAVARWGHTATKLADGRVLVAGGASTYGGAIYSGLDSAELYDPATGTWSATGRLAGPRYMHRATLLPDGRVLVVGGCTPRRPNPSSACDEAPAELYDPSTGAWTPAGPAIVGQYRYTFTETLLQTGKVLFATPGNGTTGPSLYDPAAGTWSPDASMLKGEFNDTATLLANGQVLAVGGTTDAYGDQCLDVAQVYDPAAHRWNLTGSMNLPRSDHTATLLANGKVLVAGGYTTGEAEAKLAELYDPGTGQWTRTGSVDGFYLGHTATLLANGEVLLAGGQDQAGRFNRAEIYDPVSATWRRAVDLGTARTLHTATRLADGKVLLVGGTSVQNPTASVLASAELYDDPRAAVAVAITPGFTGSWFDPTQNGHGFMLEVLPGTPTRLLASWFTFAPQGEPAWIVGQGPIDGNQARVQGIQTLGSGARFPPNFDATNVREENWGTLTFTFSDCDHGRVEWTSTVPGYGSGGMDLTRLTLPAGLTCPP